MERHRNLLAYWLLGLINNMPYVVMLAGAKDIHSGGVGLVYLADIFPAALAKFSAPFWFPHVSYSVRAVMAAILMTASLLTVSLGRDALWLQLLGVGFCSLQSGIGEASSLALTSLYHGPSTITAWSSGTGFAGVMGFTWVYFFHILVGLSFASTLLVALVLPMSWLFIFFLLLEPPGSYRVINQVNAELGQGADVEEQEDDEVRRGWRGEPSHVVAAGYDGVGDEAQRVGEGVDADEEKRAEPLHPPPLSLVSPCPSAVAAAAPRAPRHRHHDDVKDWEEEEEVFSYSEEPLSLNGADALPRRAVGARGSVTPPEKLTVRQKALLFRSLWPYVVPLVTVYFAEYAMQSGVWSAIGFPMQSEAARKQFYTFANWAYQGGVFVSRSSGLLIPPSLPLLWVMPTLQCCLLVFFTLNALRHFWMDYGLVLLCFCAGLLGGAVGDDNCYVYHHHSVRHLLTALTTTALALLLLRPAAAVQVYVGGFTLISKNTKDEYRALALAMASISDTLGIMLSDVGGLILQGCIYRANGIPGATFTCGAPSRRRSRA